MKKKTENNSTALFFLDLLEKYIFCSCGNLPISETTGCISSCCPPPKGLLKDIEGEVIICQALQVCGDDVAEDLSRI